ncbi:MAG: hypothetical protein K8T20_01020 [Planctomycetes bacterium]|nr:hypothetical protein [Planctomycetota bacterium]
MKTLHRRYFTDPSIEELGRGAVRWANGGGPGEAAGQMSRVLVTRALAALILWGAVLGLGKLVEYLGI